MVVSHVINPATSDNELKTLVEYVEYKLLKQYNEKLKAQWREECERRIVTYIENKMQKIDGIVALKVEQKKWNWHPLFHIFTTIPSLWALAPTFPWTHNNNEDITICDEICNMERVSIFYPMPWCVRFLSLYTLSKRIKIPLVHLLHGGTKMNCKQWLSKGLNNKQ
jgi:hypothetical protein